MFSVDNKMYTSYIYFLKVGLNSDTLLENKKLFLQNSQENTCARVSF